MTLYRNGSALIGDKLVRTDIVVNHGKIIEIAPEIVADEQTEVVDCTNRYILPALVDIHTHGANATRSFAVRLRLSASWQRNIPR